MKNIICLIILILASCCPPRHFPSRYDHVNRAYNLIWEKDCELQRKGFYQPIVSSPPQKMISYFKKHYQTKSVQFDDIENARDFFCKFIDEFLAPLNEDVKLRAFLKNYPLTWINLDLTIEFGDKNWAYVTAPYFAKIEKAGRYITYYTYDPKRDCFNQVAQEDMESVYAKRQA